MSSFVDLMANDVWSDADITNRTEAMLRSQFSLVDEQVLNRKVSGAALGVYTLTPEDRAEIQAFAAATLAAQQAGIQARADMALLHQALALEAAHRRLAQPVVEDDQADAAERAEAQAVVDAATPEATALYYRRNPPPPPPPPEEPLEESVSV